MSLTPAERYSRISNAFHSLDDKELYLIYEKWGKYHSPQFKVPSEYERAVKTSIVLDLTDQFEDQLGFEIGLKEKILIEDLFQKFCSTFGMLSASKNLEVDSWRPPKGL